MRDLPVLAEADVVRALLVDQLLKLGIVVVGLFLLAAGMVVLWRRLSRHGGRD